MAEAIDYDDGSMRSSLIRRSFVLLDEITTRALVETDRVEEGLAVAKLLPSRTRRICEKFLEDEQLTYGLGPLSQMAKEVVENLRRLHLVGNATS